MKREKRLTELLGLFKDHILNDQKLRAVALFGTYARGLADEVRHARSDLQIFTAPHPARMAMNQEGNQERFGETFRQIKEFLEDD